MIALEELIREVRRFGPGAPVALIVGESDCDRLLDQIPLYIYPDVPSLEAGALAKIHGVRVFEDPGLPPGNYEIVASEDVLARRLHLIKLGVTVTPDGAMKPADWWVRT